MQCLRCKYLMTDFDVECPRCGFNPVTDKVVEENTKQDAVKNFVKVGSNPPPPPHERPQIKYAFPSNGMAIVARNSVQYGPYSLEEINGYLKSGNLLRSDQMLTENDEWVSLRKIEGIIVPPPAPPTPSVPEISNQYHSQPVLLDSEIVLNDTERANANALAVFGFLFPIFGVIIWLIAGFYNPKMASIIGRWTLIGFIVGVIILAFIGYY